MIEHSVKKQTIYTVKNIEDTKEGRIVSNKR